MTRSLILASGSPRRRELLREYNYDFRVIVPSDSAECGICSGETPPELVARLAYQKAADVAQRTDQGLVIACDTVAECLGQILGKPQNINHAREMLRLLRGREHSVYSGLCLWQRPGNETHVQVEVTKLVMDPLSDEALEDYLTTEQWEGKAGAFGFQDGHDWVKILQGSATNVVGLPMELLATMLQNFEVDTP